MQRKVPQMLVERARQGKLRGKRLTSPFRFPVPLWVQRLRWPQRPGVSRSEDQLLSKKDARGVRNILGLKGNFGLKHSINATVGVADVPGSREVSIATVGTTFEKRARLWSGDSNISAAIVAPGGPTVSAAIPSADSSPQETNGVLNVDGLAASIDQAPLDSMLAGDALATGSLASGSLTGEVEGSATTMTSPEAPSPPIPAPQGGRWYGKNVTFAASAEGVFQYLSPHLEDENEN